MRDDVPSVTVVVPTRGRPGPLAACLRALGALRYPPSRVEIIVVDDDNAAPVAPVVEAVGVPLDVTVVRIAHGGPAHARNAGARRAGGALLAFTDDDCTPAPGWLAALTARATRAPGSAVGGPTVNATPGNPYASATTLLIDHLVARRNAAPDDARFLPSSNLLVPADPFRAVGGFDASFAFPGGEDREFCERWRAHGFKMAWAPDAVVHHAAAARLRSFLRQHYNYGRGASRLDRTTLEGDALAFQLGLLRRPFAIAPRARALHLSALLVVCQLATAAGWLRGRAG